MSQALEVFIMFLSPSMHRYAVWRIVWIILGKERRAPFWSCGQWVEKEGRKGQSRREWGGGEARAGLHPGEPWPEHVLWAHTASDRFLLSCHNNTSSRKAEPFFILFSDVSRWLVCNNFLCMCWINEFFKTRRLNVSVWSRQSNRDQPETT